MMNVDTLPPLPLNNWKPLPPKTYLYKLEIDSIWRIGGEEAVHYGGVEASYQILEEIGSGGFGTTYLAVDTLHPQQRHCVVKQLQQTSAESAAEVTSTTVGVANTFGLAPSCMEAELLLRLGQHPQIPTLLDAFEAKGQIYIVQEFVPGRSLRQEWREGDYMSEAEAIDLLSQLLEVVMFIHHRGAIHRDIKPSNILRSGVDNCLFLIDYGAVKQLDGHSSQSDKAIGSRGYAAPEQMDARPRLNSDIYSLGIVAIEALTGIPGYQLHEGSSTGPVLLDNYPISPGLRSILTKMVDNDPFQRYQMATDVIADLRFLTRDRR